MVYTVKRRKNTRRSYKKGGTKNSVTPRNKKGGTKNSVTPRNKKGGTKNSVTPRNKNGTNHMHKNGDGSYFYEINKDDCYNLTEPNKAEIQQICASNDWIFTENSNSYVIITNLTNKKGEIITDTIFTNERNKTYNIEPTTDGKYIYTIAASQLQNGNDGKPISIDEVCRHNSWTYVGQGKNLVITIPNEFFTDKIEGFIQEIDEKLDSLFGYNQKSQSQIAERQAIAIENENRLQKQITSQIKDKQKGKQTAIQMLRLQKY